MNVVYMLTSNFVEKAVPSMRSVLKHNPKGKIYLLTQTDTVDIDVPVTVINISDRHDFDGSINIRNNFGGSINLLKVCLPEILTLNKILWLDADTIICKPLDDLWKTNLTGKWIAAVPEYRGRYHPFGRMYYNMGVALINLQQLRKDGIMPEMVEYLNVIRQPFADQDAWNKYGMDYDKFVTLDVKYNENFATGETDDPVIIHYCGIRDWWTRQGMHRGEYLEEYR